MSDYPGNSDKDGRDRAAVLFLCADLVLILVMVLEMENVVGLGPSRTLLASVLLYLPVDLSICHSVSLSVVLSLNKRCLALGRDQ